MGFLTPAAAWFALALPVIAAMYILKRTYKNTEISSHLLWRRVLQEQEANRPWQRLRSRWLLLLQLLVAMLLVLALMGPYIDSTGHTTGHAVLMIDRSASMTTQPAKDEAHTRLELALQLAEQWIDEQSGNRPITLITAGALPEVLTTKQSNQAELKRLLRTIQPYYGKADQAAALSMSDSLLHGSENGSLILITDGQWIDAEEANMLDVRMPITLMLIDGESSIRNAALLYFGIQSDPSGEGNNIGTITVRNDSDKEQRVHVNVYAENDARLQKAAELVLDVAAGGWESAEVSGLPDSRYYKAHISGLTDAVLADNSDFAFPSVERVREVLIITEGNLFLEKALLLAGVKPVKINPSSPAPTAEQAENIDWIIVDGSYEQLQSNDDWSDMLAARPIWIIDHPQENDPSTAVPSNMRAVMEDHPVTAYLTFNDTYIGRFATPAQSELDWGSVVLTYGGIPAIYAGESGGLPRLRFTFDMQNTDLPLRPEFPVLIVQAAQWMSGGSQLELGSAETGQELEVSLRSDTTNVEWLAIELAGAGLAHEQALSGQTSEAAISENGHFTVPSVPGLYKLIERNDAGSIINDRLLAVSANLTELSQLSGGLELSFADNHSSAGDVEAEAATAATEQQSLLVWAVLFMLLVMLVEWEVYRRGYTS